jgi:hypothetical protein
MNFGMAMRVMPPNDPSSPTPPTAPVERNVNVENQETANADSGAAFGAAPLLGDVETSLNFLVSLANRAIDSTLKCQPRLRRLAALMRDSDASQLTHDKSQHEVGMTQPVTQ